LVERVVELLKLRYLVTHWDEVGLRFREHLVMSLAALAIALVIALPLGILIHRFRRLETPIMTVLNIIYTIPSLALLVLLLTVPLIGLGTDNAIIVLVVYAQVILVRNIVVGLNGVDRDIVEAARGMGMSSWQQLIRVELPLALPVIIAGLRIAAVAVVGIGAIAGLVNAGGFGRLLFDGISRAYPEMIVAGALGAATLAGLANVLLHLLERRVALAVRGEE
jgi:osmoprotectant transport system permease protein